MFAPPVVKLIARVRQRTLKLIARENKVQAKMAPHLLHHCAFSIVAFHEGWEKFCADMVKAALDGASEARLIDMAEKHLDWLKGR